jgi:predicted small lipoprotein YifL
MTVWKRLGAPLTALALVLTLGACGNDGPGRCPEGQTGTPPSCVAIVAQEPCTQSVVDSGSGSASPLTIYWKDFSVPESGRLDITVDWTVASSRIGVYVVPANTCTIEELNARTCSFLVRSEPGASSAKPLKISTPNFAAGNYRWMIGNGGSNQESLAYQVVLSKGPCAPLTGGAPGAASARGDAEVAFERVLPLR